MKHRHHRRVVLEPMVTRNLHRGISQIVSSVRPTLGPTPRVVAVERPSSSIAPELLDDAGVIARRITELEDRDENVGAMLVRNMLWRLREQAGDGTATAAVVFEAVYEEGRRHIAAGVNASRLRHHLGQAAGLVGDALACQSTHSVQAGDLAHIAKSVGADDQLAELLAEVFDVIGRYGNLEFRDSNSRELRREYVEGSFWKCPIASSSMITDQVQRRTFMERPVVVMSDLEIADPQELVPVLQLARQTHDRPLLFIGRNFSERALALLLANHNPDRHPIVAVKTPGMSGEDRRQMLEDLSRIVGGRALSEAFGDRLSGLRTTDLGTAQRAWATSEAFGVVGGKGDPRSLREHLSMLRATMERSTDVDQRQSVQERIGRLMGAAATLWIGAATEAEAKVRRSRAEQAAKVLRGMASAGVVPGGGTALYMCKHALQRRADETCDPEERAAYQILQTAVEAPIRTLIANSGAEVDPQLARIVQAGPNHGFDAITREVADLFDRKVVDVTSVQQAAAHAAITSAALALTIECIVHDDHER